MINEFTHFAHLAMLAAGTPSPSAPPPPADIPNPAPSAPPGLQDPINTVVGWAKWLAIVAGVIGLIVCGVMMMIGRRNRHSFAADGASGIPWVLAGLTLVSLSAGIVGVFLH